MMLHSTSSVSAIRILVFILLLLFVLYAPFWLYTVLILISMIYFSWFFEGTVLFLLSDLLYGVKEEKFYGIVFISFIFSVLLLVLIEFLKKRLKFYRN